MKKTDITWRIGGSTIEAMKSNDNPIVQKARRLNVI